MPFDLMMRRRLPETFHAEVSPSEPIAVRRYLPVAFLGLLLIASGTIGNYTALYMTTYAIATLHMRTNVAFGATIVIGVTGVALDLVSGALSDRIGRKPMMLVFGSLLLLSIFPAYHAINRYPTTAVLLGAIAVMSSLLQFSAGPSIIWLTESLPASIRSSGVSIVYALAIALFGGTAQYSVTWLIKATGNPLAPAWYWMVAAAMGLVAMLFARESAPRILAKRKRR